MIDLTPGLRPPPLRITERGTGGEVRRRLFAVFFSGFFFLSLSCSPARGRTSEKPGADRSAAVVLPSGARYEVEISANPDSRAQGLMFRESLAAGRGMLFLFPAPSVQGFWMKNCNFPIDIVWMDSSRKVIFVNAHTPPCKDDPCPTYGPKAEAQFVLEIPDGAAAKEKIVPGSVLKFENVPPPPKE